MYEKHALIIDDNAKNVRILADMLAEQGVSSNSVLDPRQLDTILQNIAKLDVVFLDLEFPGIDGYEIFEKLKNNQILQTIPIVAYTIHASEMLKAHQMGYHSFLGKPIDSDMFPEQLARILHGEQVWGNI